MHVFISDLHMDDTDTGGSVSDADLLGFVLVLERLFAEKKKKILLVFVGDVFELLRSPRWEVLWREHKSVPWSGMGANFRNFQNGHAENCAIEITNAICGRYARFSTKLKSLVQEGIVETKYVFGRLVMRWCCVLSIDLRQLLVKNLAFLPKQKRDIFCGSSTMSSH